MKCCMFRSTQQSVEMNIIKKRQAANLTMDEEQQAGLILIVSSNIWFSVYTLYVRQIILKAYSIKYTFISGVSLQTELPCHQTSV